MIDYEKRAMIEAEDKYTFRQSSQISSQTGLIGYLRADMDTDGNGFFSSWNDYRKDLKTDEFKQEFDEVINSLREEGDILHNRKDLAYYCYTNPQSKMPTEQDYYGVRVDTDKYAYLLRLNPNIPEFDVENDTHMKVVETTKALIDEWNDVCQSELYEKLLGPNSGSLPSRRRRQQAKIKELPSYEQYATACSEVLC